GQSYVQEARDMRPRVEALIGEDLSLHLHWRMVGRLQRNKARQAVDLFDAIDSVDRADLARELDRRAAARGRRLEVLLQVDLCGEPQKGGVQPERVASLLSACAALEHLRVVGLMTVPAANVDPEASRPAFARLRQLRDTLRREPDGAALPELSMGMSGDFEVAIEEGATLVRVGTALFGRREKGT
ncbi:MAG: YggS family pyridoxal phosphate-dependent enzyme, partial [Myxococcota bacterium]